MSGALRSRANGSTMSTRGVTSAVDRSALAALMPVFADRVLASSGAPVLGSAASIAKMLPSVGVPADQPSGVRVRLVSESTDSMVP